REGLAIMGHGEVVLHISAGFAKPGMRSYPQVPVGGHQCPAVRRTDVTEYSARIASDHSALMPANLITFAHFSVSSAISFPNSAGESARTGPPRSASRAFIVGSARAALISLLSVSMILAGVFLGAPRPPHALASKPGRNSPTVGRSGSVSQRVAVVTAKRRSLSALICSIVRDVEPNGTCPCPPSRSVITGPPPRYGT